MTAIGAEMWGMSARVLRWWDGCRDVVMGATLTQVHSAFAETKAKIGLIV